MRKLVSISVLLCCQLIAVAQGVKELKVGDTMPAIPLGVVINNYTDKTNFSDFNGKLVILDFWNSNCSSCISNFPHMSQLQEEFKDKIQVFLVNHEETQQEIEQSLSRKSHYKNKKLFPDNLPSIVSKTHGDNILNKLFPSKGETGYHVWIGQNEIIQLRGPGIINTNKRKIADALNGKSLTYISDDGVKQHIPIIDCGENPALQFSSIITRFDDRIGAYFGAKQENAIDTLNGTIRNSFFNYSILDLYTFAVKNPKFETQQRLNINKVAVLPSVLANDKWKYTHIADDGTNLQLSEDWLRNYTFCYEIITPDRFSEEYRRQIMLHDLNQFFGNIYNINGQIETYTSECWQISGGNVEKLKSKAADQYKTVKKEITENGRRFSVYQNMQLHDVLLAIMESNPDTFKKANTTPIVDTTLFDETVNVKVPAEIKSIDELRNALNFYGLKIEKKQKQFSRLLIKEK